MGKVFFISDPHFGHENVARGVRKMTSEESDELIIKNWNKVVTKHDTVYVLGDFVMERKKIIESYISRLNGNIVIVGGNHDDKKCCREYARLGITVLGCLEYKGFFCTHVPIHPSQLEFCRGNIHGHIHKQRTNGEVLGQLEGRYYNVNCEFNNYTPILFEDIVKYFNEIGY
jgi:calcineurin-like phosphoesterase family protein